MNYVFYFLCGVLYVLGLPFGWSYEETSVYICIYAFPLLVTLPFVAMTARMVMLVIKGRRRWLGAILLIASLFLLYLVSGLSYAYFDLFDIDGSIHEKFTFCMNYLSNYSGRIGMTYEELNMAIYVIAPLTGFLMLSFIYMLSLFCRKKKNICHQMNTKKREEIFNNYVAKFKELGYDVYSPSRSPQFFYAFVTDGTHIIYFQIDDWGIFEWSIQCVPDKKIGSGMILGFDFKDKESVERAFLTNYGKPYRDFKHFSEQYEKRGGLKKL